MAYYLATRRNHKFPPLLLVGYQPWVFDDQHERWEADGTASASSVTVNPLDSKFLYNDFDDTATTFYALDGQHRLMAILGLKDLLTNGQLFGMDINRLPRKSVKVTRDSVVERIKAETGDDESQIHSRLESLLFEEVGVEIIPAVSAGETYRDALFRLRSVFVDVNENAKKLTTSELGLLDENDPFRVIARNLVASHPLLENERVDLKATRLNETSPYYSTLKAIGDIARSYLSRSSERFRV